MKIVGVIPARYSSSRLEGKPLADICGKPMIWWVYHNAIKVERLEQVIVATDDNRIMEECKRYNIPCMMTSIEHPTGSDRVSEVANKIEADIFVTIQGDEPLLEKEIINEVIDILLNDEEVSCATLRTAFKNPVDVVNRTTPKVVCDLNGDIMLISRVEIPYPHNSLDIVYYKAIGTYAFRSNIIKKFSKLERGPIELAEDSELIRLLENGYKIRTRIVQSETMSVDTKKDLMKIRKLIEKKIGE